MLYSNYWTWATEPRTGGKIILEGPWHRTPNIKISYGGASKKYRGHFPGEKSACGNVSRPGFPKIQGPFFEKKKRLRQRRQPLRASKNMGAIFLVKKSSCGNVVSRSGLPKNPGHAYHLLFEKTPVKYFPKPITERTPIKIIIKR